MQAHETRANKRQWILCPSDLKVPSNLPNHHGDPQPYRFTRKLPFTRMKMKLTILIN